MNNRDYKSFSKDEIYHIYNRGNAKENIFINDQDRGVFICRLRKCLFPNDKEFEKDRVNSTPLPDKAFSLISYCLMPNHFHFLIKQNTEIPISTLMSRLCTAYSKYFNKKYKRIGHLFQDQFKQVHIDNNEYLKWVSCYIHQNPKVAGLITDASSYKWSSYAYYLGRPDKITRDSNLILDQFKTPIEYKKFVEDSYKIIKDKKNLELENYVID